MLVISLKKTISNIGLFHRGCLPLMSYTEIIETLSVVQFHKTCLQSSATKESLTSSTVTFLYTFCMNQFDCMSCVDT